MTFGFIVTDVLLPVARLWGRLPKGSSKWFAWLLNSFTGLFNWFNAWGGWWQADPGDNSVLIFLAHNMVELNQFAQGVGFGVFDAILRFQSLAASLTR